MILYKFSPRGNSTTSISCTQTTTNVALSGNGNTLMVYNQGSSDCYINFGTDSTVTATTSSYPIPAGSKEPLERPSGMKYLAAICATGQTTTLLVTVGDGI